jgi:dihydrofolate reductase
VFGGPWAYGDESRGEATGPDAEYIEQAVARIGAVVGGRKTYDAARGWRGRNPFGVPMFIVTHRPEEQPESGEFAFVDGVEAAVARAKDVAEGKDVSVMGGPT